MDATKQPVVMAGPTVNGQAGGRRSRPELKGNLGVWHLFFSVMAWNAPLVIVFAAIPIVVGLGNGIGAPGAFLIAGAIIGTFAVGFTRMVNVFPRPGAFYAYITAGLGKELGLGSGLVTMVGYFTGYAGAYAFLGVGLNQFVQQSLNGPEIPWYVWGAMAWTIVSILGYLDFSLSAKVLTFFLASELVIIVIFNVAVFLQGGNEGISVEPLLPTNWFNGSFAMALLFAAGMFGGFEITALFRGESRNPERTVPRAAFMVIGTATLLYALTAFTFVNAFGLDSVVTAAAEDPAGSVFHTFAVFGGKLVADVATVMVVTSTFAVLLAGHNIVARYVFNLSADRILPVSLSQVHKKHGSPHLASIATSIAALLATIPVAISDVDPMAYYAAMLGITSLVLITVIFLTNIAIPLYMWRHARESFSLYSTLVCPILAGIGLTAAVYLSITNFPLLLGSDSSLAVLLGALLVSIFILGIVLASVYRRTRPHIYAKIGRQ